MTTNAQVQTLVDNYKASVEKAAAARKTHLEAKAEVRNLRSTLETLVEFGVVSESVFAEEDAAEESNNVSE